MPRLLYIRGDTLADTVPGNTRSRPVFDGRDIVMGKITWDRYIPFIKNLAAGSFYAPEEVSISICLGIILPPRIQ